ncbi:MAG: D-lactate dehydrogenase [Caulobacteraceae bacterium]|nr:D-lactate dehydrogenase [Caulobacteraceae bacterium]
MTDHQGAKTVARRPDPAGDQRLVAELKRVLGRAQVLTGEATTRPYRNGYRCGGGPVVAVARPASLVELWRAVKACVEADRIVIMQAANTGLTGGSTPDGDSYDRGVVVISTLRIKGIYPVDGGRQVVCLPGATLYELEEVLKPLGREPHSVIGSSCIGASVLGGVANNSGGSLVNRGPAFTQMALYGRRDTDGVLHLVNHMGIDLGEDPETVLGRLDRGEFKDADVSSDSGRLGSDKTYAEHVRQVEADTPARFNADPSRLFEASGSAGHVVLFAARLDTFPQEKNAAVFYVGTNEPSELTAIRRHVLSAFETLPIAGEYMHRDAYDLAEEYGKDTFLAIKRLGTGRLPKLFAAKAWVDGRTPAGLTDAVMQAASRLFPSHLPQRMQDFRARYEHYLMLKIPRSGVEEARAYLTSLFPSASGDVFECTPEEGAAAFLHRFAAAGAAVRYRAINRDTVEDIVALDIALRRNDRDWVETLPPEIDAVIERKLYYGHFLCHVFHQDYVVRKGVDPHELEQRMLVLLDQRGAEYPAEHNVGLLYKAKPAMVEHYRALDPCNCFNPGTGGTSKFVCWG